MKCKDCPYFYEDFVEVPMRLSDGTIEYTLESKDGREYCHWQSRCPGDIAPCEETEDEYEEVNEYEERN